MATTAFAQADPGDVGVYFDPAGTATSAPMGPFVPVPFWVIGSGIGPISGWEATVTFSDPSVIVQNRNYNPPIIVNVGSNDNHIIGLGGCFDEGAGQALLVQYDVIFLALQDDVLICLAGSTPSSFAPSAPGYLTCGADLIAFGAAENGQGVYPDACGVLNPTSLDPVAVEAVSFGAVKADF
jgi:hypothetical protein